MNFDLTSCFTRIGISEQGKLNQKLIGILFLLPVLVIISCGTDKRGDKSGSEHVKVDVEEQERSNAFPDTMDYSDAPSNRVNWQKPDKVIAMMGDLSNKTVAEIGSGTGFFTFRILPLAEKTIGIDIDKRILNYLDSIRTHYLPEEIGRKLELRYVEPDNPEIKDNEADIILIANTFAYLPDKETYLRKLKPALKESGRIFIVDYKMHRIKVGPDRSEKVPQYKVEDYLIDAGYHILLSDDRTLPYQYIIIAEK